MPSVVFDEDTVPAALLFGPVFRFTRVHDFGKPGGGRRVLDELGELLYLSFELIQGTEVCHVEYGDEDAVVVPGLRSMPNPRPVSSPENISTMKESPYPLCP